jgi:DeoR family myo-inositol catabolism operon transcriptional repressor
VKLQRIQQIEEYLKTHGSASLDELCHHFDVSKNTIRRDLNELESQGSVKKVYGGVIWNEESRIIPTIAQREITMRKAKATIARKAAEFVSDNDIIMLDSGTTVVQMIGHLTTRRNLTIITNSVPVLNVVLAYNQFHVIVTGGDLYHPTASFVGMEAISWLKRLNASTLFLAATGVSLNKGITNYSTIEAEMKKAMIEISERVVLLVDHTKFDVVSLMAFADFKDIDMIITDIALPAEYEHYCAEHQVQILVASELQDG